MSLIVVVKIVFATSSDPLPKYVPTLRTLVGNPIILANVCINTVLATGSFVIAALVVP